MSVNRHVINGAGHGGVYTGVWHIEGSSQEIQGWGM